MTGSLILVVDDEIQIRRFLKVSLEASGYPTAEVANGTDAIAQAALLRPDLIILDIQLPDMNGLDVLTRVREWSHVPVIILSVQDSDKEKIAALDAGADDYLTKPFSVGELLARLRVAQRHAQPEQGTNLFQIGSIAIDIARRLVTRDGEPVKLTPTEYSLLRLLVQHVGKVLTHRQILREVWGRDYENELHYLRVYTAQLRQKLEADPTRPQIILTESGVGYRMAEGTWS
jgi:two-component system KDP operon response regulator KdpE